MGRGAGGSTDDMGPLPRDLAELLERFRAGQRSALARAISVVEDQRPGFQGLLHGAVTAGPRARRLGLTGPPGAGKSSLAAELVAAYRERGEEVGVVAVDPTSTFSGGALLGDRIRMNPLATDPGVFIRSMATRGSLGGLATTSREVVDLMDAFGFDRVLVETVGVGQTELEIAGAADTVVVVLVPESGDGIQAMKAGLMEIGDVFVVNKADRPGADRLAMEIRTALQLRAGDATEDVPAHGGPRRKEGEAGWHIPVLPAVARSGEGLAALREAVEQHRAYLEGSGELERRRRVRAERRVQEVVERELRRRILEDAGARAALEAGLDRVGRREETPYSLAREIVQGFLGRE